MYSDNALSLLHVSLSTPVQSGEIAEIEQSSFQEVLNFQLVWLLGYIHTGRHCPVNMDKARAKRFANELLNRKVAGWTLEEYINCGKSAVVFKVRRGDNLGAIKFFDPDIIDKYGAEIQVERIEREKLLIGKDHPNLVKIFDGGCWESKSLGTLYFVLMEYLPWKNLAESLIEVPVGNERSLIRQLASAARFLEDLGLCHRDIKPENIVISADFQRVKLLDFGVIHHHGAKGITDGTNGKVFVGTLKYSPPEFLLRQEESTVEGWRAITYYQLGAVLHDLIVRRPLFVDFENPFARLVNAVQQEIPRIESKTVAPALVELARYCLVKPVKTRLQLVTWEHFERDFSSGDVVADLKSRITRRNLLQEAEPDGTMDNRNRADDRLNQYISDIQAACRLECVENRGVFPPVEVIVLPESPNSRQVAVQFDPSKTHSLHQHLRLELTVRWIDPDSDISEIAAIALVSSKPFDRKALRASTTILFKGIYSADTVRSSIITALYRALDSAQEWDGKRSQALNEICEIDLTDGESERDNA